MLRFSPGSEVANLGTWEAAGIVIWVGRPLKPSPLWVPDPSRQCRDLPAAWFHGKALGNPSLCSRGVTPSSLGLTTGAPRACLPPSSMRLGARIDTSREGELSPMGITLSSGKWGPESHWWTNFFFAPVSTQLAAHTTFLRAPHCTCSLSFPTSFFLFFPLLPKVTLHSLIKC